MARMPIRDPEATAATSIPSPPVPEISRAELIRRLRDRSTVVLNVLPREAYAQGHVPGSINLPVSEIGERARAVIPDLDQLIVVYCGSFT